MALIPEIIYTIEDVEYFENLQSQYYKKYMRSKNIEHKRLYASMLYKIQVEMKGRGIEIKIELQFENAPT